MCTVESPIHQNIKQKIVESTEQDTIHMFRYVPLFLSLVSSDIRLTGRTLKNTARVYKNAVSTEVVRLERRPGGAKFEELRELVSGARGRKVYEDGDPDAGVWS
jgi:NAD(P)H-dependent flavin oxidoreductase YrpB (nitropropane dioxygenase family)